MVNTRRNSVRMSSSSSSRNRRRQSSTYTRASFAHVTGGDGSDGSDGSDRSSGSSGGLSYNGSDDASLSPVCNVPTAIASLRSILTKAAGDTRRSWGVVIRAYLEENQVAAVMTAEFHHDEFVFRNNVHLPQIYELLHLLPDVDAAIGKDHDPHQAWKCLALFFGTGLFKSKRLLEAIIDACRLVRPDSDHTDDQDERDDQDGHPFSTFAAMYTALIGTLAPEKEVDRGQEDDDDDDDDDDDEDGEDGLAEGGYKHSRLAVRGFRKICCLSSRRQQTLAALRFELAPKLVRGFVKTFTPQDATAEAATATAGPQVQVDVVSSSSLPADVGVSPDPNINASSGQNGSTAAPPNGNTHEDEAKVYPEPAPAPAPESLEHFSDGINDSREKASCLDLTKSSTEGNVQTPERPRAATDLVSPDNELGDITLPFPLPPLPPSSPAALPFPGSPFHLRRHIEDDSYDFDNYNQTSSPAQGDSLSYFRSSPIGGGGQPDGQVIVGVQQHLHIPQQTLEAGDSPEKEENADTTDTNTLAKWSIEDATRTRVLSQSLDRSAWLDDVVVNNIVHLAMLSCAYYPLPSGCFPLQKKTSAAMTKCKEMVFGQGLALEGLSRFKGVGFANNKGSTHWSLTYLDFDKRIIATVDSMMHRGNGGKVTSHVSATTAISASDSIAQLISQLRPQEDLAAWRRRSIACLQQSDTHNCGVFAIYLSLSMATALGSPGRTVTEPQAGAIVSLEDVTIPTDLVLNTSVWRYIIAALHHGRDQSLRASLPDDTFQQPALVVPSNKDANNGKAKNGDEGDYGLLIEEDSPRGRTAKKRRISTRIQVDGDYADPAEAIDALIAQAGQVRLAALPRLKEKIIAVNDMLVSLRDAQELLDNFAIISTRRDTVLRNQIDKITAEEKQRARLVQDLVSLPISGSFPGQKVALEAAMEESSRALIAVRRCYQGQLQHLEEGNRRAGNLAIDEVVGELDGMLESCRTTQQSVRESIWKGAQYLQQLADTVQD
ncbi:hypothetical protein VMCG_10798 [Cytospora schulzeri]|uniref:Ubiquitin-like protease family profile domain-containing protein n=1 Tax=Cytospora schulzeri TaxID=448051 RepID=A0A423VAA6_9PEZI|nr:hypothetical protein VMCG_10798 [Valsa malicola]